MVESAGSLHTTGEHLGLACGCCGKEQAMNTRDAQDLPEPWHTPTVREWMRGVLRRKR
jgi:hypothetical protein